MNKSIKKIVIENFRSIKKQTIECDKINIFTGLNDTGKSNILKALNLFFNDQTDFQTSRKFDNDFNKIGLAEAQRSGKKKQVIRIRIYFKPPPKYHTLKTENDVYLEKTYTRDGFISQSFSTENPKKIAQITRLYNRIKFIYVPALKGTDVLQRFLGELGKFQLISQDDVKSLNININSKITGLNEILKESKIKFDSSFRLPIFLQDFWQGLSVQTAYDNFGELQEKIETTKKGKKNPLNIELYQIPLSLRGEGIKSKFIPALLKWLQTVSTDFYIWGIDEPENSLEFSKAQELAELFYTHYSSNTQIFATSHSLAFIFPDEKVINKPKIFRCIKDNFGETEIYPYEGLFGKAEKIEFAEEIGILEIQKEVIELFRERTNQLDHFKSIISKITKPLIFFEGSTDKKIAELAYQKIYGRGISEFEIFQPDVSNQNADIGTGAKSLNNFLRNYASKIHNTRPILGIFDYDEEGFNHFNGLLKNGLYKLTEATIEVKVAIHSRNNNVITMLLPCPNFRNGFTDKDEPNYCHFSIELYFEDSLIEDIKRFYPYKEDKSVYRFIGDKNVFFNEIEKKKDAINFGYFKILFEKIENLLKITN